MSQLNQSQFNKSRLDKFYMVVNLPTVLKKINTKNLATRGDSTINDNTLQFSIYGSVVPNVAVPSITQNYAGQSFKVSSHTREPYSNVSVNFTVDNKFNNYWVIYKWLDLLNNDYGSRYDYDNISNISPSTRRTTPNSLTPPEDYQTDFTIYVKDEFDKNIVKFTYTKAFPVSLGSINYNYRSAEEIESTFEFAFSQLHLELL